MSVTAAKGFSATGGPVGIKGSGRSDMAIVLADAPVVTAAVFTQNKAAAAPVQISRAHLKATGNMSRGVVLTSGNANAATGAAGLAAATTITHEVAQAVDAADNEILICQTGLIGIPFPIDALEGAIAPLANTLGSSEDDGNRAAVAIMTTDTFAKEVLVVGDGFVVGAMAKGAAMLEPNMATMLSVITTDAEVSQEELAAMLIDAVGPSFNSLIVDGATSTNDTVIALASGLAGPVDNAALRAALAKVCLTLAEFMAFDAEGATKAVRIKVTGAKSDNEAHQGARKVANSLLVKCSLNGEDPYWGRVLSEVATAGIDCDPLLTTISYGGTVVSRAGEAAVHDHDLVAAHMKERWILLEIDLGLGSGVGSVLTTDLGHGYIDENRTTS